ARRRVGGRQRADRGGSGAETGVRPAEGTGLGKRRRGGLAHGGGGTSRGRGRADGGRRRRAAGAVAFTVALRLGGIDPAALDSARRGRSAGHHVLGVPAAGAAAAAPASLRDAPWPLGKGCEPTLGASRLLPASCCDRSP